MPDRSSHQGPPEEWNHGSHAARGPFSAPTTAVNGFGNGFGNGAAGSHRARPSDGHGTQPTAAYGAGPTDGFGASADSYGANQADGFGSSYGASTTDGFGARVDSFGAGRTDTFGARPGAADPFGDAASLGTRTADPFGPATTAAFAAVPADAVPTYAGTAHAGTGRADAERPAAASTDPAPSDLAETRGFLGALFDFGFTSFVTPKVIKVLYLLIVIGTVVSALVVTIIAFKASVVFGILMLVFGDPLFILIVLAIYRIILEFFVVTFRVAEDVRALRQRGDLS
jgi:hypothetical protein